MAEFKDEWLVPTLTPLLEPGEVDRLRMDQERPDSLWETVTQRRRLTDDQVLEAVAARFRLQLANVRETDPAAVQSVPENLARRYQALPLRITDSFIEVATANPFDMDADKMLSFATGLEVRMLLASPAKIREQLDEVYRPEDVVAKLLDGMVGEAEVSQIMEAQEDEVSFAAAEAAKRPIIKLVDTLLADGIASRASDIHIEPVEGGLVVRYRIDGVLRQVMRIPRSAGIPLVSRIKIVSGMDISDRLRPQDGRTRMLVNKDPVDLRVSTLPATHGEKIVIRVLNTQSTVLSLDALGLMASEREAVEALLRNKEGIILVTGPTGSGKTTTLYATLRAIQSEGVNIVTVEDPVEYRLGANIVQVQTNERAGLTFATALRSILRQDPDVVLVGEIRDGETAQIAIQASLTGHLVLSTLHTNDAPNSVTRLTDMGMEGYKIASALRGVVAQRLVRRLCPVCREVATDPPPPRVAEWIPDGATLYRAVGCPECTQTGYRGRLGVVEILTMSPELERLIGSGATADTIAQAARVNGMRSLFESAIDRALLGLTSIEEVMRVTDPPRKAFATVPVPQAAPDPPPVPAPPPPSSGPPNLQDGRQHLDAALPDFDLVDEMSFAPGDGALKSTRARLLLVDDEEHLRRAMRDLMERAGYQVLEAADGVEALDMVDRHAPDVIILDLNLPGIDGYEVLAQIRSRPAMRGVPVVVLTAKGDEDNEVRVLELGAADFLTKPFRARALAARIDALLDGRRPS
jgi:type II secretory ATPase GspE/PulE/Tfp pilus assembly ATPase PilB-like protein/CheY-like chemotaxis protein